MKRLHRNGFRSFVIIGAIMFAISVIPTSLSAQQIDFTTLLRKVVPNADRFSQLSQQVSYSAQKLTQAIFPAYRGNEQVAAVFYSTPNGYNGKLYTLTVIDMKGVVQKVSVFSHTETPAYVTALNDGRFLRQFDGISLLDKMAFLIGKPAQNKGDIVAITGATDTSKPIALAVSEARKLFVEIYGS